MWKRCTLRFVKKILAVKQCTQNDFIYGETGRTPLQTKKIYEYYKILA